MKIGRASYDATNQRLVVGAYAKNGNRMQIDFVGPSAFLLNRVLEAGANIAVEADNDSITFRRVDGEGRGEAGGVEDGPRGFATGGIVSGNHGRVPDLSGNGGSDAPSFRDRLRRREPGQG